MPRRAVMFNPFTMLCYHRPCMIVTGCTTGAMHRASHNGHSCATQRRYPRREEHDGQIEGNEAAYHQCRMTSATMGAATLFGTSDSLLIAEDRHKSSLSGLTTLHGEAAVRSLPPPPC
jgi:hypothetical protein